MARTKQRSDPLSHHPVRRALADQLAELADHEPGARAGDDPEHVHKMRVAVRRLRAILRRVDEPAAGELRGELSWLGDSLGAVRDGDVLLAHLRSEAASMSGGDSAKVAELLAPLRQQRSEAQAQLFADLDSDRFQRLVGSLEAATGNPAFDLSKPALRKAARKQFRRAVKDGEPSPNAGAAALHKRRIRVKRARYLAELQPRRARKLIAAAKRLQDTMGEHQDGVVARRLLRELVLQAATKDAAVLAGRLIEREDARIGRSRRDVDKAWRRFARAGRRAWG